jgi:glycosyltransferase involved in cell wall biosynthesis
MRHNPRELRRLKLASHPVLLHVEVETHGRFDETPMLTVGGYARPWRKILVLITEDWFALSHFVPLLTELRGLAGVVVVATRSSGRLDEVRALGIEARAFDMQRGSLSVSHVRMVRDGLARLIDAERPDVVHAVALQPMVMASLALHKARHRPAAVILHLTGRGYLGFARTPLAHVLRMLAHATLRRCTARTNAWLVAENSDDLAEMTAARVARPGRTAIMPGAGIDPLRYPQLEAPHNGVPRIAYVGRMLKTKGLHVLLKAQRLLRARGAAVDLALYGDADSGSREAISKEVLASWAGEPGVSWHGHTDDIVGVWRAADIAVVPALGGDGMPRAMLEAAACGRPLIVSDIPGCRQFVRPGIEGLIVPPGDDAALADALATMAADRQLRLRAGAAARRRGVREFTEAAVRAKTREIYQAAYRTVGAAGA